MNPAATLVAFARSLKRIDVAFAGRAYAAYSGVYIASSLAWLWSVAGHRPDRWDALARSSPSPAPRSFSWARVRTGNPAPASA